jgi:DNA-binding transcriptional LysR family regulator
MHLVLIRVGVKLPASRNYGPAVSRKTHGTTSLAHFIPVAEELGFSRAAERLNVSQPPLSRQIRDLESELNVKLLNRNRHKVKLTRVGRALLVRARELIGEAELLRKHADDMEGNLYEELVGRL